MNYVPLPELSKAIADGALCASRAVSAMCRFFPWPPRMHEGVIEQSGSAFVFLDRSAVENSTMAKWMARFPSDKALEYTSYFAIHNPGFANALNRSTVSTVFLFIVDKEPGSDRIIPRSLFMSDKASIVTLTTQRSAELAAELNSGDDEWIPPDDFSPSQQFKLIE